ncbi:MAG TPA: 8-oxo-dGTP diphosphatase [Candidatus Saccharimonadales bacterium]|jgi:mutator protein MutT|nr:8-oxo-dGTP diphosphatase [Candidatus Saccharimonadales bacterium]
MRKVTLLFLLRDGHILLAMKKRGFGEGKWNGAGGKVEPGETVEQAAIRECQEEIGVTPINPELLGDFEFRMSHDPAFGHHAHVFVATKWEGEPHETEEMRPEWFANDAIPYASMWSDDPLWLPLVLQGKHFSGKITLGPRSEVVNSDISIS